MDECQNKCTLPQSLHQFKTSLFLKPLEIQIYNPKPQELKSSWLNWHKYTIHDSWLHLLAGFIFTSKRMFCFLATVSSTPCCKCVLEDFLGCSVRSSASTPRGSDPGWTLTFAPAQASGGQMRVPWAPEASTACSPPGEDRGQREESTAPVLLQSWGLVSPRNILLTKANHRPSPKLRNGELHSSSLAGGIAKSHARERGRWETWRIGAANPPTEANNLHPSCPAWVESQSFQVELVSAWWPVQDPAPLWGLPRRRITGRSLHSQLLSSSSSCIFPYISLK